MTKRKSKKKFFNSTLFLFFIVCVVYFGCYFIKETGNSLNKIPGIDKILDNSEEEKEQEKNYNDCIGKDLVMKK